MTYDILLSLRGWGTDEFRYATRETAELARFALYAEKVAPYIGELEKVIAMPLPEIPQAKLEAAKAKREALRELPLWRAALGLEDEA